MTWPYSGMRRGKLSCHQLHLITSFRGSLCLSLVSAFSFRAFSQVVKLLVKRLDLNAFLLNLRLLLGVDLPAALLPRVVPLLRHTDRHVEVGNLVGVLTRGRHLDWASPVEVEVAQRISQRLQLNLLQAGLVQGHVEVGG